MIKKALLVIDVQVGLVHDTIPVANGEILVDTIKGLITKARASGTPVFFIQHNEGVGEPLETGSEGWEIHPGLGAVENDIFIQKSRPDSFFETNLDEELKKLGVDHVILAGIQTEVCVDTTTRRANSMGYKVTLATDAHGTWDTDELTAEQVIRHHNRTLRWFAETKESCEVVF